MLSAIQTTSKETTLQEHAAAEHGSAHDIPAESPKFRHPHKVMLGLYIGAFLGMLSETSYLTMISLAKSLDTQAQPQPWWDQMPSDRLH